MHALEARGTWWNQCRKLAKSISSEPALAMLSMTCGMNHDYIRSQQSNHADCGLTKNEGHPASDAKEMCKPVLRCGSTSCAAAVSCRLDGRSDAIMLCTSSRLSTPSPFWSKCLEEDARLCGNGASLLQAML